MAHGVLIEARERNIRIPNVIAVIGFGDQEFAAHTSPGLTTVKVDRKKLGIAAAREVLASIKRQPDRPSLIDVGFAIITRETA